MSKMTNCQNDHGGRELNGEPTHTIIWEPYGILQSFVPHSLHSFNDFILLFIHSFPIRLFSHSFSYSSTLTVIPFNLTISLWQENETLSWIAKTSKNGHFCVTTKVSSAKWWPCCLGLNVLNKKKSMAWCKKDVTPLLTHQSYVFLALTHRNYSWNIFIQANTCKYCLPNYSHINNMSICQGDQCPLWYSFRQIIGYNWLTCRHQSQCRFVTTQWV